MSQVKRTKIIQVVLIFVLLLVCGVIGYLNGSGRIGAPAALRLEVASPTNTRSPLTLQYCADADSELCVTSFGRDSAQNSLIVIKNTDPAFDEIYLKIKRDNFWRKYDCRRVDLLDGTYYCVGNHIPDGENVTVNVYQKDDNRMVARAVMPFAAGIASLAEITVIAPTEAPVELTFEAATGSELTPGVSARRTEVPGRPTAIPTATRRPSYPNPSYP